MSYGVNGQVLTWIDSFLSDRKMTVVVDGHTAKESIRVLSGVPQVTVLGPLLFLVYINDIVDDVSNGTTIRLFTDDCLVYRPLRKNNEDEDQRVLQCDLDALEAWADKWGMRFYPSKCQIMQAKRGNSSPKLHLYELMDTVLLTSPRPNTWVCGCQATSTGTTRLAQRRIKRIPPCTSIVATCQDAPAAPESMRLDH